MNEEKLKEIKVEELINTIYNMETDSGSEKHLNDLMEHLSAKFANAAENSELEDLDYENMTPTEIRRVVANRTVSFSITLEKIKYILFAYVMIYSNLNTISSLYNSACQKYDIDSEKELMKIKKEISNNQNKKEVKDSKEDTIIDAEDIFNG